MEQNMTKEMADSLNKLLASTAVFAQKVHNIHWNMEGKEFVSLHLTTDEVYTALNNFIDVIAEKIIMQGYKPLVTLEEYINTSVIKEVNKNTFDTSEAVIILQEDLDKYAKLLSSIKTNEFTQPIIDEIILFTDKYRWFFKKSQ